MNERDAQVVLITGASSGIGRICAETLDAQGYRVYGTSRKPPDEVACGFRLLQMDINDSESVAAGVQTILDETGRIDVAVNNAGFGYGGAVEDTSIDEAKAIFEANFFGVLRVCRAVLPTMRKQRRGLIVNVSSIGGLMGLPYQGLYCATKFAVEGMSEALRMEVKPFGVHVTILEPGDIHTPFTANRRNTAASQTHETYREPYQRALAKIEADEIGGDSPEVVAKALLHIVRQRNPKPRYIVGPFYEKLAVWVKSFLPATIFEKIIMKNYNV